MMSKRMFWTTFVVLACLTFLKPTAGEGSASWGTTKMPEWAGVLPAETALVFVIEDVEKFCDVVFLDDASKEGTLPVEAFVSLLAKGDEKTAASLHAVLEIVKTTLKGLSGSFCLAVDERFESPTFYVAGNLKPEAEDFAGFLTREVRPLFEQVGVEFPFEKENDDSRFRIGDIHFATKGRRLFASTDQNAVSRMRDGKLDPDLSLAGKEGFRKAIAHVAPKGLFVFADVRRFVPLLAGRLSTGTLEALSNMGMGFDSLESFALSARTEGTSLNLKFALMNEGEFTGIPRILLRPNTPTKAAKFVPSDYCVFKRWSVSGASEAYREWQAIIRRMTDDVSWKEYQEGLAKLNEGRGFSLDEVLGNLGDEVAVAVKLPELIGIPPVLAFVSVKDEAKALDMISRFLTKSRAKPAVFSTVGGATIYTTTLVRGVFLSYTTKDGYLIIGLSPSSVASALAASESGESLAELKGFKSALEAAPRENLLFAYADMGPVARFVAGLAHWFESSFQATFRSIFLDVEYSRETAEIVRRLNLESERMGRAILWATGGDDYLSVHAEIPVGVIRFAAPILPLPLAAAREKARRTACVDNLSQILVACHQYASDHDGRFPDRLSQLEPYVKSLQVFSCPETGTAFSRPEDIDSMSSYKLMGGFALKDLERASDRVVLYEAPGSHGESTNVGFADGHVKSCNAEGFRNLMKEAGVPIESQR